MAKTKVKIGTDPDFDTEWSFSDQRDVLVDVFRKGESEPCLQWVYP